MFCGQCGTSLVIFSNEKIPDNGKVGVNLRSVEGLDVTKLKVRYVDGRSRDPSDEMKQWEDEKERVRAAVKVEKKVDSDVAVRT
jgi:hypothetical protein